MNNISPPEYVHLIFDSSQCVVILISHPPRETQSRSLHPTGEPGKHLENLSQLLLQPEILKDLLLLPATLEGVFPHATYEMLRRLSFRRWPTGSRPDHRDQVFDETRAWISNSSNTDKDVLLALSN